MNKLFTLLKRDFKNSINNKMLILLIFMVLLQTWFVLGSGSIKNVIASGKMNFMDIVFSFNIFGSIIALALTYDCISKSRENKVLDLILTSGISKRQIILSKVLNCFIISLTFAILYILIIFMEYALFTRDIKTSLLCFRYFIPITAFLSIFAVMGLMFSIIFRSSKEALIISVIIGGLFMPRLFIAAVEGIGSTLNLSSRITELMEMLSPALIMNALSGYDEKRKIYFAICILLIYILVMITLSGIVFLKQDELNYGE